MPVAVSMHACSAWPMSIDFVAFRLFLAGYSVEEAVEQLMALQRETPLKPLLPRTFAALPSSSTSSNSGRDLEASPASSSQSVSGSVARRRHRRQKRASQKPQYSLPVMHASAHQVEDGRLTAEVENPEEITTTTESILEAALPCTSSAGNDPSEVPPPATISAVGISASPSTAVCVLASSSASQSTQSPQTHCRFPPHHQDRWRRCRRSEEKKLLHSALQSSRSRTGVASSTATTHASLLLPPTLNNVHTESMPFAPGFTTLRRPTDDSFVSANAAFPTADTCGCNGTRAGAARGNQHLQRVNVSSNKAPQPSEQRPDKRPKDHAERECFCLDEGYIKFQRQLQETEAMGGAGVGFSCLQSRYLFEEVTEQYQAFRELAREEQLGSPYAFLSNYYIPIPVATRLQLLQMYYETDAGVFQWAFGDKLSRFDLPAALSAVREEKINRTLPGGVGGLGSGSAGSGSAADGVGAAASFWASRWKSSPGKLATMNAATVARLSEQHVDALRRQWENVKHVCSTVAALYRGKGGLCVPLDMPLLTTIHQCFGLRNEQALDYATAAFGFEHRLETRLFEHLHNFSEYGAICSILASLWCDRSGYLLCEVFRAGCHRLSRLLDEYRILSELHLIVFGEAMRPRWQVQLDEVQRVITTSSLVDKNSVASATVANSLAPAISGSVATPVQATGGATPTLCTSTGVGGPHFGGAPGGSGHLGSTIGGAIPDAGSTNTFTSAASPTATGQSSATNMHSPFSGNGQFSRSFLMEFPFLMKHLFRISVALGGSGGVNDGLDIFFTRIYSYLEHLSSRTAPAIVSRVMSAAAPGGSAMTAACTVASQNGVSAGSSGAVSCFSSSTAPFGSPSRLRHGSRAQSDGDLTRAAVEGGVTTKAATAAATPPPHGAKPKSTTSTCFGTNVSGPTRSSLTRVRSSSHLPQVSDSRGGNADATTVSTVTSAATLRTAGGGSSCPDDVMGVNAPCSYVVSPVVNTSLFQASSVLLPLTGVIAANNGPTIGSFTSSQQLLPRVANRGLAQEDEPANTDTGTRGGKGEILARSTAAGARVTSRSPPSIGVSISSPTKQPEHVSTSLLSSQVSDMVLKVVDKRYLRELCKLLTALPHSWQQLTALTKDDHTATDRALSDLAMALKAITQVLMASDDFH
ncbi:hypothetical protein JKF63_02108 [Porcisia hertigi]|uniref:Uncharacterized protein n=1 Tax=Porcisia hertigi TaxID=2761500 RepID=A0A836IGS8_9TRYP|nr:hypothetical protein JKF63_02108 [Porcisia hertigi]